MNDFACGIGNPIGGLVFSSAFSSSATSFVQMHEWTNFVAYNEFCIRGCKDGPDAPTLCQHIYDVLGCEWNMPGNYSDGVFEDCKGDDALVCLSPSPHFLLSLCLLKSVRDSGIRPVSCLLDSEISIY